MLSEEERARSAKFHFEGDRRNFIARRSLLRAILGHYLRIEPSQVSLAYEERGKPRLAGPDSPAPLHFNCSHSRDLALCAVSRFAPLGLDVNGCGPCRKWPTSGPRFVPPGRTPASRRPAGKEAGSLFQGLDAQGSLAQGHRRRHRRQFGAIGLFRGAAGLVLPLRSPAPGFVGALARAAAAARPRCWRWGTPTG